MTETSYREAGEQIMTPIARIVPACLVGQLTSLLPSPPNSEIGKQLPTRPIPGTTEENPIPAYPFQD